MRNIRKSEQKISTCYAENRDVRLLFSGSVQSYDWLVVTHSKKQSKGVGCSSVGFHSHPNALELILFQKSGSLDIGGERHNFMPGDAVVLEPQDIHGANELNEHDCICILLGREEPQKMTLEGE
jgi:hypothetical protein